jgi:predicted phosphodiesterase
MKIAIISDIHANIEALEAVLARIDTLGVDQIACLGDVVGYGASPDECCTLVRKHASFTLLGNHDAAVTGAMDEAYYYDSARTALRWTREHLSEENYKWLYGLPYTRFLGDLAFFHSAPIMPSGFFYVVQNSEASTHLQVIERMKSVNFIGHAHLTTIFAMNQKKVRAVEAKQVSVRDDAKFIVNVGSVGQPRDRDPRACFAVWDDDANRLEYQRVEYDVETAATKILAARLDEKFAKRLYLGI